LGKLLIIKINFESFESNDNEGTEHGSLPHINIKRSDRTMVRIDIDG